MAAQLSYAPAGEFRSESAELIDSVRDLGRKLQLKETPACVVRMGAGEGLDAATAISREFLKREILPIVELRTDDPISPLRNLVEFCALGTVDLIWSDGEPGFREDDLLGLVTGAGRNRLLLDLILHFHNRPPVLESFQSLSENIGKVAGKYSHIQSVKLAEVGDPGIVEEAIAAFEIMLKACRRSKPSAGPSLWINNSPIRAIANDLGIIAVDTSEQGGAVYQSADLKGAEYLAGKLGIQVVPRLPLLPRYYAKGWFSFEVGKVLDSWTGRKAFLAYRNRPDWLED